MLIWCELSAKYVYISGIGSVFYVLFRNDHLLFYLLFIVIENILYKTNLLSMQRNLKATSGIMVLILPDIKTVHFVFGFGNLCFPCNWVILCDSLEFVAWRGKQDVICQSSNGFCWKFLWSQTCRNCLSSFMSGFW